MDLLSDILSQLRLTGTLYFRTSFTSPWGVRVPPFEKVSRFHFAHRGRCLVRVNPNRKPVQLDQGDLIIIPGGAAHTLYCDPETEDIAMPLDDVVNASGFTGYGTLVYGESGTHHETQLICGHFAFDSDARHPLIECLPEYIHVENYGLNSGSWMENTLKIIGEEAGKDDLGSELIATKLSEIIYAQAIRTYLQADTDQKNKLAGFSDSAIAKALTAIHRQPDFPWTLEKLASTAGVSRTSLATRFMRYLSVTPLSYVTSWRMQLARQKLVETGDAIIEIAESVGYHSEAAFGRAFKKHFKVAPATYRRSKLSAR